jgi:hypothetical protein
MWPKKCIKFIKNKIHISHESKEIGTSSHEVHEIESGCKPINYFDQILLKCEPITYITSLAKEMS